MSQPADQKVLLQKDRQDPNSFYRIFSPKVGVFQRYFQCPFPRIDPFRTNL